MVQIDVCRKRDSKSLQRVGSASDWLNQISHAARPIRSTTQILVVTRHQYGISALVSQTSFGGETSGSVAKCRLFSQAIRAQEHVECIIITSQNRGHCLS